MESNKYRQPNAVPAFRASCGRKRRKRKEAKKEGGEKGRRRKRGGAKKGGEKGGRKRGAKKVPPIFRRRRLDPGITENDSPSPTIVNRRPLPHNVDDNLANTVRHRHGTKNQLPRLQNLHLPNKRKSRRKGVNRKLDVLTTFFHTIRSITIGRNNQQQGGDHGFPNLRIKGVKPWTG